MKTILGLAAVSWLMFAACGGDSSCAGSPSLPEQAPGGAAGEGSGSETTAAGAGGDSTSPTEPSSGSGGDGGAPENVSGAAGTNDAGSGGDAPSGSPVTGHIKTKLGAPLPGAIVIIEGKTALTDDTGAFTFDDVAPSYDLTVIHDQLRLVEVVDGLSTREPTVRLWESTVPGHTATISGKLAGGVGSPLPKATAGLIALIGEQVQYSEQSLDQGSATYSLPNVKWEGGAQASADVVGLEWTIGATGPTSYEGAVRQNVLLKEGTPATVNLTFTKPEQKTVTGTWTVHGSPMPWSWLQLGSMYVPLDLKAGAFSVVVPNIGATPVLQLSAQVGENYFNVSSPATSLAPLALEMPPGPQPIVPVNGAAGVTLDTEFKFELPPQTFALNIWLLDTWIVVQVTDRTSLRLPDLRSVGIVYEPGASASWQLEAWGPTETPEGALTLIDGTSPSITHAVTTYASASHNFYLAR